MNILTVKPFDRSFTIIPDCLWGGAYPGSRDPAVMHENLKGLTSRRVGAIINLMEEGEIDHDGKPFVPYEEAIYTLAQQRGYKNKDYPLRIRMPIPDVGVVSPEVMEKYLNRINWCLRYVPVFIHCWGGRGRTGTVMGCLLANLGMVTGEEALIVIKRLREASQDPKAHLPAPETKEQRDMVRNWTSAEERFNKKWEGQMGDQFFIRASYPFGFDAATSWLRTVAGRK